MSVLQSDRRFSILIGVLKFLGVNLLPLVWVSDMIRCPECKEWISGDSLECSSCGASIGQFFKELEGHGFFYIIVNPIEIPNDC